MIGIGCDAVPEILQQRRFLREGEIEQFGTRETHIPYFWSLEPAASIIL
jgi:hypothetical protein